MSDRVALMQELESLTRWLLLVDSNPGPPRWYGDWTKPEIYASWFHDIDRACARAKFIQQELFGP